MLSALPGFPTDPPSPASGTISLVPLVCQALASEGRSAFFQSLNFHTSVDDLLWSSFCSRTVCAHAWLCASACLIYSTAGWQSNKRMSMGDLTSANIPIIIPLKLPVSVCNPSRPQRRSGPSAHKNHLRFNAQNEKEVAARPTMQGRNSDTPLFLLPPLPLTLSLSLNFRAIISLFLLHMADLCWNWTSCALKQIPVCFSKTFQQLQPNS